MSLKVKVYHECEKPSMLIKEEEHSYTTGKFWWTNTHTFTKKVYQESDAHFVCDECKSEYDWHARPVSVYRDSNEGQWLARKRTFTWKKVD